MGGLIESKGEETVEFWTEDFTCPAVCCGIYVEDLEPCTKKKKPLQDTGGRLTASRQEGRTSASPTRRAPLFKISR